MTSSPVPNETARARTAALLDGLVDLILPADCAVCGTPGTRLCPPCEAVLESALGRPFRAERHALSLPLGPDGEPLPVTAAGAYAGAVAAAVLAFKDHHAHGLRRTLGEALARAVAVARLDRTVPGAALARLVPVPGSAAGFRRRGHDPLAELMRSLPAPWVRDDVVLPPPALRLRSGGGQASGGATHRGADARARRRADRGWRVRPDALEPGTPVLLVDDVLTTGATLGALAAAVRRAGGAPVGAVVLAAVAPPRRDGTRW